MRLRGLQRWFQDHLARPNERPRRGYQAGTLLPEALLQPSATLTAPQRLDCYTRMYWLRLAEVLESDFPTVAHLCGDLQFDRLARRYLTAHPSRSWSLGPLGAHLPGFLTGPLRVPRKALLRDVARVEWAMQEVFDAPRCPVLGPDDLQAVADDAWPGAQLRPQTALRLLELNHRADAVIKAVKEDAPLPDLGRKRTWVVVWRQGGVAWRRALPRPNYVGLRALADGATVGETLESIADAWTDSADGLVGAVFAWFREWAADGLFGAIHLPR